ncbi:MAG: glutamate-5-semialdehyde dehydrogenase, partial [Nanoarchaeota archaeon]|nr:glutamate-5-semialdehyde dehydrogenase [Nanoarchaeota archaeon]
ADAIKENESKILDANHKDLEKATNLAPALIKRLKLNETKIHEIISGVKSVAYQKDPIGDVIAKTELDTGLILSKVVCPIGLIGVIFESRPDALVQISTLCLKSGNAVILKGGSEAENTNKILFNIIKNASGITDWIQLVETRDDVKELLKLDQYIDLMIPRGSNALVKYIKDNTKIPVLGHADGICHAYIDKKADIKLAVKVVTDAKTQYCAVCNAIETLLVHKNIAEDFLPKAAEALKDVELRGDEKTLKIIKAKKATEEDWKTEYNDMILSIKVVDSLDQAISHINRFSSHHTDVIITRDKAAAEEFMNRVDSSSVLLNCSTRFADGFRYGLGSEVGISTNKIHARGPVGLEGLTIYKYKLIGKGHIVADYSGEHAKQFTHKRLK